MELIFELYIRKDDDAAVLWVIIGSVNGLLPVWCQVIAWTYAYSSTMGPLETNVSEILIKKLIFFTENAFDKRMVNLVKPHSMGFGQHFGDCVTAISQQMLKISLLDMSLKITNLIL